MKKRFLATGGAGLKRTIGYYCLAAALLFGLLISLILLLPQVRHFILSMIEQRILYRELSQPQKWMGKLFRYALASSGFMVLLGFFFLTPQGRKLANKTESEDNANNRIAFDIDTVKGIVSSDKFFTGFAVLAGFSAFSIAFFRAANTGITYDEAYTYLNYVLPDIFVSFFKSQLLNNHILNSLCIRAISALSQSKYNELLIRFPSLVFYCIYIIFSLLIAKQHKNWFLIFILFISNYYLNEFFGLARGYGMACTCITAACYFFERWKLNYTSRKPDASCFLCFLFFCSLGALSNSITLYGILGFLLIINFKYKKNLFRPAYFPFYMAFLLAALHTLGASNEAVYSTHSIYSCIMSIPNMFSDSKYPALLTALTFFLSFIYLMIKTKANDDYCRILAVFTIVCIISQLVFRRGYPVAREMIPFYPVFVIIMANALAYLPNRKMAKPAFAICIAALCFQFFLKIDAKSTRDWNDNYSIRNTVYAYIASNDIFANREEFISFIKTSREQSEDNPVFTFYAEKAEQYLKNRAKE